jgi:hypothetical protein
LWRPRLAGGLRCVTLQKTVDGTLAPQNKNGTTVFQSPRLETFSSDLTRVAAFPVFAYLTGLCAHSLRKLFSPQSSEPIFRRLAAFPFTSVRAGSQEIIPELQMKNKCTVALLFCEASEKQYITL